MKILGIDEAGRGPIIGPLVVAGLIIKEQQEKELKDLGVKDSKLLTEKKRKEIYSILIKKFKYQALIIPPSEIDEAVGGNKSNLNLLEAEQAIKLINHLESDKIIIDCPSTNTKTFKEYIKERLLNKKLTIIAEHKADTNYLVVGAASIIAKEIREQEISEIKKRVNKDFGSGYMADPKTQEFLKKYWAEYPELFRKSWTPYKIISMKKNQKSLKEY
jgi:ribonuclease HII